MAYTNDGSYLLESEKKFPLETKLKKGLPQQLICTMWNQIKYL